MVLGIIKRSLCLFMGIFKSLFYKLQIDFYKFFICFCFKRTPEPISFKLNYNEFCSGCKKCRIAPIIQPKSEAKRSWVQMLIGNKNTGKNKQGLTFLLKVQNL